MAGRPTDEQIKAKIHEYEQDIQGLIDSGEADKTYSQRRIDREEHTIAALNWVLTGEYGKYRENPKPKGEW